VLQSYPVFRQMHSALADAWRSQITLQTGEYLNVDLCDCPLYGALREAVLRVLAEGAQYVNVRSVAGTPVVACSSISVLDCRVNKLDPLMHTAADTYTIDQYYQTVRKLRGVNTRAAASLL
jgi:hypothetical protein